MAADATTHGAHGDFMVAVGDEGGCPVIFRVRNRFPQNLEPSRYHHLIAMIWQYQSDNDTQLPSNAEADRMSIFEDQMTAAMQASGQAVLTAIVTGTGVREWQWYSRSPEESLLLINAALAGQELPPVEFAGDPDPSWEAYKRALTIVEEIAAAAPLS
ncbi:MAG: DUF695 domain-containing protein [Bacteroidales bacterium]|nr:DUF695 domain-containing protein [Bacteroidales bacterium]